MIVFVRHNLRRAGSHADLAIFQVDHELAACGRVVAPTDNGAVVNIVIDLDPEIHRTDAAAERLEKDAKPASVSLSILQRAVRFADVDLSLLRYLFSNRCP